MAGFSRSSGWESESTGPASRTFVDVVEPTRIDTASAFDTILVGEPHEPSGIGQSGAREAPNAIRKRLASLPTSHLSIGPVGDVADVGDVDVSSGLLSLSEPSVATVQERARDVTKRVHETDALPVFLGGDGTMTVANVSPLLGDRSLGLVTLDAHLDCRSPADGATSHTATRQLLDRGLDACCVLGAREFGSPATDAEALRERGGEIVTATAVRNDLEGAIERALDAVADVDAVYCSLDLGVLDAVYAPGASVPTTGGLTTREVYECCRRLGGHRRLVGVEVVECAPPADENDRTADAAARSIAHVLAGRERSKRDEETGTESTAGRPGLDADRRGGPG